MCSVGSDCVYIWVTCDGFLVNLMPLACDEQLLTDVTLNIVAYSNSNDRHFVVLNIYI